MMVLFSEMENHGEEPSFFSREDHKFSLRYVELKNFWDIQEAGENMNLKLGSKVSPGDRNLSQETVTEFVVLDEIVWEESVYWEEVIRELGRKSG